MGMYRNSLLLRAWEHRNARGQFLELNWNATGQCRVYKRNRLRLAVSALPSPVPIDSDTTYVVSYHAPVGRYSADSAYFSGRGVH